MALREVSPTPALKEKTPFFVMEAAKHISVCEYLQLRFQRGWDIGSGEYGQIFAAADAVVRYQTAEGKKPTHNLTDELEFSADPRVIGARLILTNVPLPEYLVAKRKVIVQAIEVNATDDLLYSSLVGWEEQRSRVEEKGKKLAGEFELINKVIWESGGLPQTSLDATA